MDRYFIIDTKENVVIATNSLEFPNVNDGGSVACNDIHEAIDEMEHTLKDIREYYENGEKNCSWCGEKMPESELEHTSMGDMCYQCKRGVESREGKI